MHIVLCMFGEAGVKAVIEELEQLHTWNGIQPSKIEELSAHQNSLTLDYLMFLKEDRTEKIKCCRYADGRWKQLYRSL